jgi:glycosyltransferase involved in cell wall biosynthesis
MRVEMPRVWKNTRGVRKVIAAGNLARDRQNWASAAAAYREALEAQPDLPRIWVQYGNMLKEDHHFEEAEAAYLEALRRMPGDADAHLMYGHLLKITDRLDEAAEHYKVSAILDPDRPDARLELIGLLKQGISDAQINLPQRGWSLNAKLAAARAQIGELLREIKNREARGVASSSQDGEYLGALNTAYDSIGPLLRSINKGHIREASNEPEAGSATARLTVVFDTTDLIEYFRHHRLPTGIQRVQMETIQAALLKANPAYEVRVCCFAWSLDYWREVSPGEFINLCDLSLVDGDWTASDWRAAMSDLEARLTYAPPFAFPIGAYMVNIGTSWWLQNYFLHIREAKNRHRIRYVPFVHDMIPIITPEYCDQTLTQDFISWATGVFIHADFYLVNSEATRKDLLIVADILGHELANDRIHTVRLDADFGKGKDARSQISTRLPNRLTPNEYVLFVGTIEARKNHLLAFNAWLRLCKDHGLAKMPKLVCVGVRGWLNDPAYVKLGSSTELQEKVVILSGITDYELAELYKNSLFTLFPSVYEGWGLPVTESLCFGKVPVTTNISSLPEAGGEFAEYFEPGDERGLLAILERLIFEADYRRDRETVIRERFKPRNWAEISGEIMGSLDQWEKSFSQSSLDQHLLPTVTLGRYYSLSRNTEMKIYRSMASGEIFRIGEGWWALERWGCWLKPRPAQLRMRIMEGEGGYRLYLGLRALDKDTPFEVTVTGCEAVLGIIQGGKSKWVRFDLVITDGADSVLDIVLKGHEILKPEGDPRTLALGLIGFLLCRQGDVATRTNFIEAVALDNLDQLARSTPGLETKTVGEERAQLPAVTPT